MLIRVAGGAIAVVMAFVAGPSVLVAAVLDGTDDAHAATTSTSAPTGPNAQWDPGLIFSDGVFRDWSSMTVDNIQTFLDHQGCKGDGCLRSGSYAWPGATVTWCDPVPAGTGSFAQMLSIITTGCRINPQVALVMIAKESQGLTRPAPDALRRTPTSMPKAPGGALKPLLQVDIPAPRSLVRSRRHQSAFDGRWDGEP